MFIYIYICSYLRIYYSNGNLHFTLRSFDFHKIHMFLSQDLLMVISEPEVVGLFGGGSSGTRLLCQNDVIASGG